MRKMGRKQVVVILILSLVISLFVSVYFKCIPTVDVVYSGCPLAWQSNVVPTQIYQMDYFNLVADVAIWFAVAAAILYAILLVINKA
jgi:hypothetical protein